MNLASLTKPELIFPSLPGSDCPTVLRAMAERLADRQVISDADELYCRLWEREQLGSTNLGSGVAIPHCKIDGLEKVVVSIGLSDRGIDFEGADQEPVRLLFLVISPEDAPADHLHSLAAISKWVKTDHYVDRILALDDAEAIFGALRNEEI